MSIQLARPTLVIAVIVTITLILFILYMGMPRFNRPLPPPAFRGESGLQGSTGAQGIAGIATNTGATGSTGSTGVKGDTGEQGLIGDTGPVGANGIFTPTLTAQTGPTGFALSVAEQNMYMTVGNSVSVSGAINLTNAGGVAYTGPVAFTLSMPAGTVVTATGTFTVNDNYGTNPIPASSIFIANPRVTASTPNVIVSFNTANWQAAANGLILRYTIMYRNV